MRPVVGYYCNLCQLIFSDEDEAKGDHCRTPAHYAKYQVAMETKLPLLFKNLVVQLFHCFVFQEKTGKDPWTS